MISAQRTGNIMGAEVSGAALSQPPDKTAFAQIMDLFLEHHVLVFRGQHLTASQFLAWANRFGKPEPHVLDQFHHPDYPNILILSNVVENGKALGLADGGAYWHTDYSYPEIPARATTLYSLQAPKNGGDTMFADQMSAWYDLPEVMKKRIDRLVGVHHYGNRDDLDVKSRTVAFPPDEKQKAARGIKFLHHPLVRRHPLTGRKALYAVSGTSVGIVGMPDDEALPLLRELAAHSTQPKYCFSVRYAVGDVVIWDNAAVLHSATLTDVDDARTLWRVTTKENERPSA